MVSFTTLAAAASKHEQGLQCSKKDINSQNSVDTPLVHLSVHMNPNAFANIQLIQSALSESLTRKTKAEFICGFDASNHSLANIYASEMQCDVLICRKLSEVSMPVGGDSTESNQTTIKVSCNMFLPVLQIGLFTRLNCNQQISSCMKKSSAPMSRSVFRFNLQHPSSNSDAFESKNIFQTSVNKACISVTAKFVQSDTSSDAVLSWNCIHELYCNQSALRDLISPDDVGGNELFCSSIAFNVKVSLSKQILVLITRLIFHKCTTISDV